MAVTHETQQRKASFSPRKLALAVALAISTLTASQAWAAGLGRLTVQSALGQPLRAEVEITSLARDEAASLSVKLAPAEAFRAAGLEFNSALTNLRFSVERRNDGRPFVRISSNVPINEPFVDLLVELNWATGKFVREYTFLLDPPELRLNRETESASAPAPRAAVSVPPASPPAAASPAPAASAVSASGTVSAPSPTPVTPRASTRPAVAPPAKAAPEKMESAGKGDIIVKPGDTLAGIAAKTKPEAISLDQAIVSIYRSNPGAFFGSVHRLRSGATLSVPDSNAMAAVDPAEARREVRVKSADFGAYKNKLAAAPRQLESAKAGQSAAGNVSATVDDPSKASATKDQLKLSREGKGKAGSIGAAGASDGVAREAALKEAQSRVAELERNVSDLQKMVELKSKQLADLQKLADAGKASAKSEAPKLEAPKVESPKSVPPVAAKVDAPKAEAPKVEAPKVEAPKVETPKVDAPKAEAPKIDAPKSDPVKAEAPPTAAPKVEAPAVPVPAVTPPKAAATPPVPVPEPSLVDEVLDNPLALGGIGAVVLAGAGLAWWTMRRRRKEEKFEDSLIAAEAFTANSLFGSTGGQTVDTSNSLFSATGKDSGDVHSTEVDPIAEAEVYIAYGRESQAEEILKEALKKQPDRQAIRLKLMEIYAGRKDSAAFGAVAQDMYSQTGGQNEEWPKVVTLGLSIDPTNPLYTGAAPDQTPPSAPSNAMMAPAAAMVTAAAAAPSVPSFDLPEMKSSQSSVDSAVLDEPAALDFDFSPTSTVEKASAKLSDLSLDAAPASEALSDAVAGRFELPSLDLPARAPAAAPAKDVEVPVFSNSAISDLGDLKIELPMASQEAPAIDLSAIGLDLQPSTLAAPAGADSARWQEMATKLDLAAAYEEIGDKEGARELLDEVVRGGDSEQQQKARSMLSKLS